MLHFLITDIQAVFMAKSQIIWSGSTDRQIKLCGPTDSWSHLILFGQTFKIYLLEGSTNLTHQVNMAPTNFTVVPHTCHI